MAYDLTHKLVLGVASSALFDLRDSHAVFEAEGEDAYRRYQEEHLDDHLLPGVAYSFVRRLLSLNDLADSTDDALVEVIVLSRNDPDTGMRVMRSIQHHKLAISRAAFMQGKAPFEFMPAFNMSLLLSASETDVRAATKLGFPAGQVLESAAVDDPDDHDLRIAFDFDGVLADDESEQVHQSRGIQGFNDHEVANAATPHNPGPLKDFLAAINAIQKREEVHRLTNPEYKIRVRVSIVTARGAPADERAVASLKDWGVTVNDAFFLGGIEKRRVLEIMRPHIFFDDQAGHLEKAASVAPSVHIPFGRMNSPPLGAS